MIVVSRQLLVNHSIASVMCVCLQGLLVHVFSWGCIQLTKKNICDMLNEHLKQTPKKSNQILGLQRSMTIVKKSFKYPQCWDFCRKNICQSFLKALFPSEISVENRSVCVRFV